MNFREQLSEAYKAGYIQGLNELQEKQSPAGSKPTKNSGKRPSFRPQDTPRKPYDEDMHEKALAELGRMVMASMHEMDEDQPAPGSVRPQKGGKGGGKGGGGGLNPHFTDPALKREMEESGHPGFGIRKALRRIFGQGAGGAMGDAAFGIPDILYGNRVGSKYYSGIDTPFG